MTTRRTLGNYGTSALSTLVSKFIFYSASFISLWLITQILNKPDYGSYAFALAFVWFASVAVSLGLDQTVFVRVARGLHSDEESRGALISAALLTALIVGSAVAFCLAMTARPLAGWIGLPALQFWLVALAPTIPLIAIGSTFENWYLARGAVWQGQTFPAIGQAVRVPILGAAMLAGGSASWVVGAEICVAILPIILFLTDRSRKRLRRPRRPSNEDISFGLRLLIARIANEGVRRIDIFMLGALAIALAVADYHVAARLVIVLDIGRELLQPGFTARIGGHLTRSDRLGAKQEYDLIRAPALLISLAIATGLIVLAVPFLALFGDFTGAAPVLLILIAGGLINVAFGPNSHFLKIAGHATPLLQVRVAMLAVLFASNLMLIPLHGAVGAALSSLIAVFIANMAFWHLMRRREQIESIDRRTLALLLPALSATLLAASGLMTSGVAATIVGAVAIAYACVEPLSWKPARAALARFSMRA